MVEIRINKETPTIENGIYKPTSKVKGRAMSNL